MLFELKNWIMTICATVFFITAVEMVLPDNSMKKYAKFVLGLILITVFLNPIVALFNSNYNMASFAEDFSKNVEKNGYKSVLKDYKSKNIEETLEIFQENLNNNCEKELKEKYPKDSFNVKVEAFYNEKNEIYEIKSVRIGLKEGKVGKVKEVNIQDSKSVTSVSPEEMRKALEVKSYISGRLNLDQKSIEIYNL
ncbi:MAG: stage III sporulation protein AF [Solirubrobacterales bacterium]